MSKRKNRGNVPHQTNSFENLVAQATLNKFGGYIDAQIQQAAQAILVRQHQAMNNLLIRVVASEEILIEKLSVTKDELANRVAAVQDRFEGFDAVEGGAELGDRVRAEIKTRTIDQTEFQGASRLLIDNVGTGATLGKELEGALLGLKISETKEVKFGKDESLVASLTVNRISRQPKPPAAEAPAAEAPKEVPSVSADAG